MKYAIVEDGGKQYRVAEGETIEVDRFEAEAGEQIDLEHVLLLTDGDQVAIGRPYLSDVKVQATVVGEFKGPKLVIFKYKPKIRYRVKKGHRQKYIRLMINAIVRDAGGNHGS
jgi:large subunit ribosomal protein L21